ncbi:hypothetical protein HYPSUDRAFT_209489 [Hypholoma sublateritium FD-334 SS-4]|uniref:Uncharacterized protein n=1 Tax=Hypholoma sublateritium (strain FD-334 SS-4) TaxID=945553 RepID=A0A0D2N2L2_HYPSF|nr:hypothetical protein HYPSUDRAFT_209489 [Hypholoma sublateritium FD-334 SS-4]
MSSTEYVLNIPLWTEDEFGDYNIDYRFVSYKDFFGTSARPKIDFDCKAFDGNLIEKRYNQKFELINLYMHHNSGLCDDDSLNDYALALLLFAGYATSPRHLARNIIRQYNFKGGLADTRYNISLQSGLKTVLFVVIAGSVVEGVAKVLAGALSVTSHYIEEEEELPTIPAIILVDRIIILAKVTIPEKAITLIGNNICPHDQTTVDLYSPINTPTGSINRYDGEQLSDLFQALEAFKSFIYD